MKKYRMKIIMPKNSLRLYLPNSTWQAFLGKNRFVLDSCHKKFAYHDCGNDKEVFINKYKCDILSV